MPPSHLLSPFLGPPLPNLLHPTENPPIAPLDFTARLPCSINDPTYISLNHRRTKSNSECTPHIRIFLPFNSLPHSHDLSFDFGSSSHPNFRINANASDLPIRQHIQSHVLIACGSSDNASWDLPFRMFSVGNALRHASECSNFR